MTLLRKVLRRVAATTIALLFSAAPAHAGVVVGGAVAPSAPLAGGSEYGVSSASATQRPVVTALSVPSTSLPGRPPRVTLRIDEPHVRTVNVQVAVHNLATRKRAIVAKMGWVRTGRTLAVVWPRHATLKAGIYHVSVSAHDHHSGNLKRTAHSSGVATLTVQAPVAAPPVVGAPAAPEPGVPTPAQTVADGAVFPVAGPHTFGGPDNRYGAPRTGHIHEGQDILAAEGTPDVAPLAGTITYASFQAGGAGYYAVEHTLIGFDFMFAHCKAASLLVSTGQVVAAGQPICQAGQTGSATAPHLHFEMWVGGWQAPGGHSIDPLPYLEAWEHSGG
jgi:murein DD-endopeptidase MepM/ murein hydrolase activator NlpD